MNGLQENHVSGNKHKSLPELIVSAKKKRKITNGAKLLSVKRRHSGSSDDEKSPQSHRHLKAKRLTSKQ